MTITQNPLVLVSENQTPVFHKDRSRQTQIAQSIVYWEDVLLQ